MKTVAADFDPDRATPAQLRREVDRLQGEVEALREALGLARNHIPLQVAFGITRAQALILLQLADGAPRTAEALILGYTAASADEPPQPAVIKQLMVRLRRAIEPYGIIIATAWGSGFHLVRGGDLIARVLAGEPLPALPAAPATPGQRLGRAPNGEFRELMLGVLAEMEDATGKIVFTSRYLARRAALQRSVRAVVAKLEADGDILVEHRPPPHAAHAAVGVWIIRLAQPERAAA